MTCDEFIVFLRACNPRDDGPDGWRVMLPGEVAAVEGGDDQGFDAKAHEQTAMLAVHRRLEGTKGADRQRWRPVTQADVTKPQRGRDGGGKQPPTELAVKRVDLHNAQAMIDTLRGLRMSDAQVATVVSAIFVEKTPEAYAKVPPDHGLIRQPRLGGGDACPLPLCRYGLQRAARRGGVHRAAALALARRALR